MYSQIFLQKSYFNKHTFGTFQVDRLQINIAYNIIPHSYKANVCWLASYTVVYCIVQHSHVFYS